MRNRTIVTILAVLGLLALVVAVQPVFACEAGCTPGYWRQPQHLDSWGPTGYAPEDFFHDVCGVGPYMTLLDALKAKGGGENAFLRHAAAALLSAGHPDVESLSTDDVCANIVDAYGTGDFETPKDYFAWANELGCPLD